MLNPSGRARWVGWQFVRAVCVASVLVPTPGCADRNNDSFEAKTSEIPPAAVASAPSAPAEAPPAGDKAAGSAANVPAIVPRKLVFNASVTLVVESLAAFEGPFARLVKDSGSFVSQSDRSSNTDAQGRAVLTVRVPVDQFDEFLTGVGRLGELQQKHIDSQDVTQMFYDIEARIANKQQEEKRLLKHLSDSTGKLEDILAVERELTRVRGEIEQMQGRIRYLSNVASLSTVTVTVTEIHKYVPPVAPTFAAQIARTFHESLDTLIRFGKSLVILAAAIAPWLPIVMILSFLVLWLLRKFRPNSARTATVAPPAQ